MASNAEVERLTGELAEARETIAALRVYRQHDRKTKEAAHAGAVKLSEECDQLRAHILDIAAHATPYGDIPDEPGYVGTYLLTAGALHRALGKIGHTAPSCKAEAERDEVRTALLLAEKEIARLTAEAPAGGQQPIPSIAATSANALRWAADNLPTSLLPSSWLAGDVRRWLRGQADEIETAAGGQQPEGGGT